MIADTGCQSSTIPLRSALLLGIQAEHLLPVTIVMREAIKEDLGVIGAIIFAVAVSDMTDSTTSIPIFCDVSNTMERGFLGRETLVSPGHIHTLFPGPAMVLQIQKCICIRLCGGILQVSHTSECTTTTAKQATTRVTGYWGACTSLERVTFELLWGYSVQCV
jgi:hypothetical protein